MKTVHNWMRAGQMLIVEGGTQLILSRDSLKTWKISKRIGKCGFSALHLYFYAFWNCIGAHMHSQEDKRVPQFRPRWNVLLSLWREIRFSELNQFWILPERHLTILSARRSIKVVHPQLSFSQYEICRGSRNLFLSKEHHQRSWFC